MLALKVLALLGLVGLTACHAGVGAGPRGVHVEAGVGVAPSRGGHGPVVVSNQYAPMGAPGVRIPTGGNGPLVPDGQYDPSLAASAPGYGPSPVANVPEGWHFASFAKPPTGRCLPPKRLVITNICRDGPNGMQECKNDCV